MKASTKALSPDEVAQVARTLNVKESDVVEMEQRLQGQDIALEPSPDDGDEMITPIAYLREPGEGPSDELERTQSEGLEAAGLKRAVEGLDERSRRIIRARWLNESDPKTLHELADEFGVSAERIRQIEAKALQKMKVALAELR